MGVLDPGAEMLPRLASAVHRRALWAAHPAADTKGHFSLFTWLGNEPAAADLLSQANVIKAGTTDKGKMTQDVTTQPNVNSHAGISDLGLWTGGLGEPASASKGEGGAAGVSLQSGAWRC